MWYYFHKINSRKWTIACSLLLIITATRAAAQEPDSTEYFEQLSAINLEATSEYETPHGHTLDVTYLGKNSLLRQQGNTFINTLEKIPGVSAINTGVGIAKPVIRGMSLNRVIVTENGLKQEGQQWGVDHGLEIDQYSVDRVEVLKGPVSVMYGSDGIGGVINILPAIVPTKNSFKGEVIGSYKSNNHLYGSSVKLNFNKNDVYTIVRATGQSFASYRVPATKFNYNGFELPIYNNRLKNTGGQELNAHLTQGIRRKWGQSSITFSNVHQKMGFFVGAFGVPRSYQLEHTAPYRTVEKPYQTINHLKIINNTHIHLPNGKLEWELGYQQNTRAEIAAQHNHNVNQIVHNTKDVDASLHLVLQTLQLNLRHTHNWEKVKNVLGFATSYQHNQIGGHEFLIPNFQQFQSGVFDYLEYNISPKLLLATGLRLDYIQQNAKATTADYFENTGDYIRTDTLAPGINNKYVNTSFSVGLRYTSNNNNLWKLNLGTAYRAPSINELLSNGIHHGTFRHEKGYANLSEEKGFMWDLGYQYSKSKTSIEITPFVNYFTNYIFLRPTGTFSPLLGAGQIYQFSESEVLFAGFEIAGSYKIIKGLSVNTDIEYVWNKLATSQTGLPMTPPFSWRSDISFQPFPYHDTWNTLNIIGEAQYFGRQYRTYINEPKTEGYMLYHLSLSQSFAFKNNKQKLSIYFQWRNITNTIYLNNMSRYRILNLPEQGSNIQCLLRFEF